jgi:hypothetical protein
LRATARWRQQVAGLSALQLIDLGAGTAVGVLDSAEHDVAERAAVRALAFMAEAQARFTPKEETDA